MDAIGMFTSALILIMVFSYCTATNGVPRVCDAKYKLTIGHSACATPNTRDGIVIEVTEEEKAEIVDFHNNLRKAVSPPATDMFKMTWDSSIANIAQGHAETCIWGHESNVQREDFGRFQVGQNIISIPVFEGPPKPSWTIPLQSVADDKKDFIYNVTTTAVPLQYTQMVWAKSYKVGCGIATCDWNFGYQYSVYYVCNYGPRGNVGSIKTPYTANGSERASDCPLKAVDGLCDCGSKVCLNGGTLNPSTCECTCQVGYVASSNCTLVHVNVEQ